MQRFTGRLTNLSQYFPELRHPMNVGYSLSRSKWARSRRRDQDGVRWIRLGRQSQTHSVLLDLIAVAHEVASDNEGVVSAPAARFYGLQAQVTPTAAPRPTMGSVDTLLSLVSQTSCF